MKMIFRNLFGCLLIISFVSLIPAMCQDQDATPTSKSKPKPRSSNIQPVKNKTNTRKTSDKQSNKTANRESKTRETKTKNSASSSLELTVNQGSSNVEIYQLQDKNESFLNSTISNNAGETVFFDSLKTGNYLIKVRKSGFYEESKIIFLKGGKPTSVNIELKPSAGFLTVMGLTEEVEVEVKDVGIFTGKIEDIVLPPRIYEVIVTKDGFETSTQIADVRLGQTTIISVSLQPISFAKLLQNAETDFLANRYKETISNCRLVLKQNPEEPRASLLMGYSYFNTERPQASCFYLTRALSLQNEIEFPVKIYQKEKNTETLTDGILKLNRAGLNVSSNKRPELNFAVSASSINKLDIIQDKNNFANTLSPKPDSIEIKATINNGRKIEKKSFRIFPRQAFARVIASGKTEIAGCSGCSGGECLCQKEIQAIYELLLNWKSGTYPRQTNAFPSVAPPSTNFTQVDGQSFSLEIPDNWQAVEQSNNQIWFAPYGGFSRRGKDLIQYGYAVNIGVRPINKNDLRAESKVFQNELLSVNNYLESQGEPKETIISGRSGFVSNFVGFSVETKAEESVQIYTTFTPDGNFFYLITVNPFNDQQKYKSVFHRILKSVTLR